MLTRDKGTSQLAQGPSAHTCLVEIERFEGPAPRVKSYDPPIRSRSIEEDMSEETPSAQQWLEGLAKELNTDPTPKRSITC